MIKKMFLFVFGLVAITTVALAQTQVAGKVTDEKGSPIDGVTITEKGTNNATATDINGMFKLKLKTQNAKLVFSLQGFTKKEVLASNEMVVILTSLKEELSEVVVTSLGIKKEKKALTYAASDVKGSALQQKSENDVLRSLNGKVPGVDIVGGGGSPGQSTRITIRGNVSFNGDNQPLFVVDGIPFDNSVNNGAAGFNSASTFSNRLFDIDPNNIENMTVLKGISATALYGQRASNGVILITTKSGTKAQKKLEVTYTSSYSNEKISSIPDYQSKYGQGSNQNYNGAFIGNWGAPYADQARFLNQRSGGILNYDIMDSVATQLNDRYPGVFPNLPKKLAYRAYDVIDGFFKEGQLVENSVSFAGGNSKNGFRSTISRSYNEGIIPNSSTGRTSVSLGGVASFENGFVLSGNINYVNTTQQNPLSGASYYADYGSGNTGSIFSRLFYFPRSFPLLDMPFENPVDGSNVFYRALDNPLWTVKYNLFNSIVNRTYGNLNLSKDVTKWLTLTLKGGFNEYTETQRQVYRPGGQTSVLGYIWQSNIRKAEKNFQFLASTKSISINTDLSFTGNFGLEANERKSNVDIVFGNGFIVPNLYKITNTSTQATPGFYGDYEEKRRILGAFASFDFSYKTYLFLNITGRNDWSSSLPENSRSYFYPSIGTSFVFSEALNLPKNIINYGKIRVNFASTKRDVPPYQLITNYNITTPSYVNAAGSTIYSSTLDNTLKNANLKPESIDENEFGLDLAFLDNRIKIDATYYIKTSSDLFITKNIAPTTGFSENAVNGGSVQNKGIELGLTLSLFKSKNPKGFNWTMTTNFTKIKSEVLKTDDLGNDIIINNGAIANVFRVGQPYGMLYGVKNARDDKGNLLINAGDGLDNGDAGLIIPNTKKNIIGDPNPDFKVAFINNFTFNNFSLNILFDWTQGGKLFSTTASSLLLRGQLKISEEREGVYIIPGVYGDPQTLKPILDESGNTIKNTTGISAFDYHFSNAFGAYGADEVNVYDRTTFRLREISLGYSIPKKYLEKTPFGSVNISLSGRNLWFYAPNFLQGLNFDPELLSDVASSNLQGVDLGVAPSTRRYGINLVFTF